MVHKLSKIAKGVKRIPLTDAFNFTFPHKKVRALPVFFYGSVKFERLDQLGEPKEHNTILRGGRSRAHIV